MGVYRYAANNRPVLANVPPPTVLPPGPMSQAFTITNWSNASSAGNFKRGVWFKKGDVPSGYSPALNSGAAQFYGLTRWKDGSLKTARMMVRNSAIAAGASASYTITTASGALPSGATAAIGNAGLVSALTNHDFKVTFANVKDSTGAAYGGGSLIASLAMHASVGTRWTLLTTGLVADVWQGWGMAGSDPHLKVNWYVTRWKNADGSTLAFQIAAVMALDWWSIAGKTDLTYDAILTDGGATILSATGVQHYYHSQWLMCVNDGSLNAGTAPWVGATQPTLHATVDKAYAILAGVMPPYRQDKAPALNATSAYVPCNVIAVDGHRTATDAGGGYSGRGPVPRYDSDAFMLQTPQAAMISRLNALSGLSITYHYKSNRTRTRSSEAADIANTNIPLLMNPLPASAADFTAQGLPIAVNAYRGDATDGFVKPTQLASNPWGNGSLDATHAVSYCYYQGLTSGNEWFVDAQLDITMNLAHQQIYGFHQQQPPWASQYNSACPTDRYTGLLGQWQDSGSIRYFGWSQLIQGHGFGLLPIDHQFAPAAAALRSHNGDYIQANLDYLPADFAATGAYYPYSGTMQSPWMAAFGSIGSYFHYQLNEDARWQRAGDFIANWQITQALAGRFYAFDMFRTVTRASTGAWNATTNPNLLPTKQGYCRFSADLDATGTFTISQGSNWNDIGVDPPPMRAGDIVYFTGADESSSYVPAVTISGVAEGTVGYVINIVNGQNLTGSNAGPNKTPNPTFQVSATPGGPAMTFGGQVVANVNMPYCPQAVGDSAYATVSQPGAYNNFPYFFAWDNYIPISATVIVMARHNGNARVTTALRDKVAAFIAPNVGQASSSYYSAFDTVAIV